MKLRNTFKAALGGAAALAMAAGASDAADLEQIVTDPNWAATISSGYAGTFFGFPDGGGPSSGDVETHAFFGEGAALWRFGDMGNVQSDFAFHSHRGAGKADGKAFDQWHGGGILFMRDQNLGLVGVDGAFGGIDFLGKGIDVFRVGGRFEWFAGHALTVGGGVGYHNLDFGGFGGPGGKEVDGVNANVWVNFFATDKLGLKAQFDFANFDAGSGKEVDVWAITGEAEYLISDMTGTNSSIFAGGRYAEYSADPGPTFLDETQVFVGFRHYFITGGDLANNKRTNTLDNTNTILEKLPFLIGGPVAPP